MQGLSPRNLGYMRAFAVAWPEEAILQQAAAKLPWFHNCVLLDKIKHPEERLWYMQQAFHSGWNRSVFTLRATDSGEISTTLHRSNDFPHNLAGISLDAVLPKPEDRPSVHSQ